MAFTFKLEQEDGTPADPPTLRAAVPNWSLDDTNPTGRRPHALRSWTSAGRNFRTVLVVKEALG